MPRLLQICRWLCCTIFLLPISPAIANDYAAMSHDKPYPFGVLNQRSVTLTAEYWNPILRYVSQKSGIPLTLRIARTANETTDMAVRGELAFVYTNHLFTPGRDKLGYTVLARQEGEPIQGQIVVATNSPIQDLAALEGQKVAFANPYGFVGYFVPMDKLLRDKVTVNPVFMGNQEAAIGQLRAGRVMAIGVNHKAMADFARREDFTYRVVWTSEPYFDLAVMAHPSVPAKLREKLRDAMVNMKSDPEGLAALTQAAKALELPKPRGFVAATDRHYDNYRAFFRHTLVPLDNQ
ncbi:MAG: phosphate/phosphite/phosphonate ABC transporter substrate-binding protein [Thiobacillus sp.]